MDAAATLADGSAASHRGRTLTVAPPPATPPPVTSPQQPPRRARQMVRRARIVAGKRCWRWCRASLLSHVPKKRGSTKDSIGIYAVQCRDCLKWRTIPTKEEFETIREKLTEEPWFCSRKPDCSCTKPADIEYDSSRVWVVDKPDIPKPPAGTERLVIMRRDYTKMDTYYVMPNGKRVRCTGDVDKFLEAHPQYKGKISSSDFSFAPPKVVEETVCHNSAWRAAKAKKQEKADFPSSKKGQP